MLDYPRNSGNSAVTVETSAGRRTYGVLDKAIMGLDGLLQANNRPNSGPQRENPAQPVTDPPLTPAEKRHSAGLMRVNHTGEVCAQALYTGQSMVARDPELRAALLRAADEEHDHLLWCTERLAELGSRPSILNPLWFGGSVAIALGAAAVSDARSLGFVEETERQVCAHLDGHLESLSERDLRSRAIVNQMRADESRHAESANKMGAEPLPPLARLVMKMQARVMTTLAYWL